MPMAKLVIMGVSGAGKTTLGSALAAHLGWRFLDADDFHSPEAKAKIASGVTLDETDRAAWLARIKPVFDEVGVSTVWLARRSRRFIEQAWHLTIWCI